MNPSDFPEDVVIRVKRPDGAIKWLRVPGEHWPRVLELANGEFGDTSIDLGGPELPKNA
jgi:hypothetical protein